jgi:hypothetical protein
VSNPVRIFSDGKLYTGRDAIPVLERSVKNGRDAIANTTPIDGAIGAAVIPGAIGVLAMATGPLSKSQRNWGAFRKSVGTTAAIVGASMVSGFAGEGLKSFFMSRGTNPADASKNGHLIAGLGIGTALLGAAKFIPKGSPFRMAAAFGGAYAALNGLANWAIGNNVSKQEDMLAQAQAS